jgi:hypothetical protein
MTGCCLAGSPGMFRIRTIATGGRRLVLGNFSFVKEIWLHGCLGVESRYVCVALPEGLCDYEGNHFG